ncbi:RHS repeat-associated core domain-containing protein [Clostridium saccharobutylicum]|uniref:RHS repeat-associated core domain-containing protein n=1 Tax=Clostridium saccharobutylicum TaxID=169679 RepID=UPI0009852435|nr:RHS repeat-associated core domain-containing protein [Clostridium saccharobutylicum]
MLESSENSTEDLNKNSNAQLESKLNRYYYTVDEQGSTAFITDKNQQIKNEYYYDAFGHVIESKEEVHNRITYTGQQFDGITGQYYLRARFYNPVIGRFTQEDVYRGDGLNLYAYCGNNPVVYYDFSGFAKATKKDISEMTYGEIVSELNQHYEEFVKKKNKKYPPEKNSNELLKNELTYGPHGKHNEESGDNITGHHMPSNDFMQNKCGVSENESFSMNLEQIFPGSGGRHRRTFTYGLTSKSRKHQLYSKLTPRDALAFDLNDSQRILIEDGLYNKETARKLYDYSKDYQKSPNSKGAFDKDNELNNITKQCLKK